MPEERENDISLELKTELAILNAKEYLKANQGDGLSENSNTWYLISNLLFCLENK